MELHVAGDFAGGLTSAASAASAPDGTVYVLETSLERIQLVRKFSPQGAQLAEWGSFGQASGQFRSATDLTVGADGAVYVADTGNKRIQKFAPDGTVVDPNWASTTVSSLATGPDGAIYASGPPVTRYAPDGAVLSSFNSGGGRLALTAAGDVLEGSPTGVFRYDSGGRRLNQIGFAAPEGTAVKPGDYDLRPGGLSAFPDGTVIVADPRAHRLQAFTIGGRLEQICGSRTMGPTFTPGDVVALPDGQFLTVEDTRIRRFTFNASSSGACDDLAPTVSQWADLKTVAGRRRLRVRVHTSEATKATVTVSFTAHGRRGSRGCTQAAATNRRGDACLYRKRLRKTTLRTTADVERLAHISLMDCHRTLFVTVAAIDLAGNTTVSKAQTTARCFR